jgi:hypothetical protein
MFKWEQQTMRYGTIAMVTYHSIGSLNQPVQKTNNSY